MTKSEQTALEKIIRRMVQMQRQIRKPDREDVTEDELEIIIDLLWEWTPTANQELPSKHKIEKLTSLLRGCKAGGYCYISRITVAHYIRNISKKTGIGPILFNEGADKMTDAQLYYHGRWNYKETPMVDLLFNIQSNPQMFNLENTKA